MFEDICVAIMMIVCAGVAVIGFVLENGSSFKKKKKEQDPAEEAERE